MIFIHYYLLPMYFLTRAPSICKDFKLLLKQLNSFANTEMNLESCACFRSAKPDEGAQHHAVRRAGGVHHPHPAALGS